MSDTIKTGWRLLCSVVGVDAAKTPANLDANDWDWTKLDSREIGIIQIMGAGSGFAGAGDSFGGRIWVRKKNGPPQLVATFTFTLGAMALTLNPVSGKPDADFDYYAAASGVTDYWIGEVKESSNGSNDWIQTFSFDGAGCDQMYCEMTAMNDVTRAAVFWTYVGAN